MENKSQNTNQPNTKNRLLARLIALYATSITLKGIQHMNLNQVTLPVSNMAEAVDFYRTLGFNLIVDSQEYARFECPEGEATFSLSYRANVNNQAAIYFEHEALDTWVAQLINNGITFQQMPTDQRYLWREAVLFDPSGNKVILYWAGKNRRHPPWRVN
jgi:catechol 2,3-dioxygenase-like lactoylglutathione lyase family enzyme